VTRNKGQETTPRGIQTGLSACRTLVRAWMALKGLHCQGRGSGRREGPERWKKTMDPCSLRGQSQDPLPPGAHLPILDPYPWNDSHPFQQTQESPLLKVTCAPRSSHLAR
jgi:hypothetical protein